MEQGFDVAEGGPGAVRGLGDSVEEVPDLDRVGLVERIVGGKQDPAGAREVEGVAQQALPQYAAAVDVDVGLDVVGDPAFGLKATLSSRAPSGMRSSASRMLALFQCSSIAMSFIVMSFRVQVLW